MEKEEIIAASVDFGRKATAVIISFPYAATGPRFVEGELLTFENLSGAMNACEDMRTAFRILPKDCKVHLLEEQQKNNQDTPMMEAAYAALACSRPGSLVVHVPTSRVSSEFGIPRGCGHPAKKKAAEKVMDAYIDAHPECVSDRIREILVKYKKRRHDIADAFNQVLWFSRRGKHEISMPVAPASKEVRATDPRNESAEERRNEQKAETRKRAEKELLGGRPPKKKMKKARTK